MRKASREVITFSETAGPLERVPEIKDSIGRMFSAPLPCAIKPDFLEAYSASSMTSRLVDVLDKAAKS